MNVLTNKKILLFLLKIRKKSMDILSYLFKGKYKKLSYFILCLVISLVFLYVFIPHVWLLKNKDIVLNVNRWSKERGHFVEKVSPRFNSWVRIEDVSNNFINALIVSEDGRFFEHGGIDLYEIKDSIRLNWKKKRYARGGSTITQQVVKMVFLSSDKNIIRKLRELIGAVLIEKVLSKNEILEWYVNLIEFGNGVYGIKKGAGYYFRTHPSLLTVDQAINLALVLPAPNSWNKGLKDKKLTSFGEKRFYQILLRLKARNLISEVQFENSLKTGNFGSPLSRYFDENIEDYNENNENNENNDDNDDTYEFEDEDEEFSNIQEE